MKKLKKITFALFLASFFVVLQLSSYPAIAAEGNNADNTSTENESWNIHGQSTEILQGYPSFPASYSGANSLPSGGEARQTTTATLFMGASVWSGGELYFDPELQQGFGLDHTLGIAGFPNGEATKAGSTYPRFNEDSIARLFLRQTIDLGGPTEKIEDGPNQLAKTEDISRVTITAGKLAATDIFDDNSYSHDPRTQFLNWSMMDSAAWDIPADARGYTQGATIELNQEKWALRYGAFLEPRTINGEDLTTHGFDSLGQAVELEERYTIIGEPGKLRLLTFLNRDRAGNFDDALALPGDVNNAIDETRHYGESKYGFAVNAEQQLTKDIGAFTRVSWNNGQTEDWTFTQIDESLAFGLSMQGARWGRDDDTVGIGEAINGISSAQQRFLENGGTGFIIGDGNLNYGLESIFEAYYNFKINKYLSLTPDYQFVENPGYNEDRGPVNIFSVRLHAEF